MYLKVTVQPLIMYVGVIKKQAANQTLWIQCLHYSQVGQTHIRLYSS